MECLSDYSLWWLVLLSVVVGVLIVVPVLVQMWTFSSSGWLFTYQFGVVKCLRDLGIER